MSRRIKKKKSGDATKPTSNQMTPNYDKNLYDHLKPENRAKAAVIAKEKSNGLYKVIGIVLIGIIFIALALGGAFTGDIGINTNSNNDESNIINTNVEGVQFVRDLCIGGHTSNLQSHYHAILSVAIRGQLIPVPEGIGDGVTTHTEVSDECMRPIHTHVDDPGKLHVEIPSGFTGVVTLGDFFAIWSEVYGVSYSLSSTSLLDQTGTVTISSNSVHVQISNPASYEIKQFGASNELISLILN
ncbi:MAG: hypothetical protein ACW99A_17770 [Candidatus Kariarchaeaceae archaeon]|jgi:hypothetical protein